MNFKEAYTHYKNETANEEEKAFVEEQLENFQLLLDHSLEEEPPTLPKPEPTIDFYPIIKQQMRKKRVRMVLLIVLIPIVMLGGFRLWKNLTVYPLTKKDALGNNIYSTMMIINSELFEPEYIREATNVQSAGIGSYHITYTEYPVNAVSDDANWSYLISDYSHRGKFYKKTLLGHGAVYELDDQKNPAFKTSDADYILFSGFQSLNIEKIKNAPKSTRFSVYVKLQDTMTLEEILAWNKENRKQGIHMGLQWMPIFYGKYPIDENSSTFRYVGFDFYQVQRQRWSMYTESDQYPLLDMAQIDLFTTEPTIDQYETHIKSMLTYALEHDEFLNRKESVMEGLKLVENHNIASDVLFLCIDQEDFVKLLEQGQIVSGHITDAVQVYF